MTIEDLINLMFSNQDNFDIFMTGFWLQAGFEVTGWMIRVLRLMRNSGADY